MPDAANENNKPRNGRSHDDPAIEDAAPKQRAALEQVPRLVAPRARFCSQWQLFAAACSIVFLVCLPPKPALANDSWWSYAVPPKDSPIQAAITDESVKTLATIDMPEDEGAVQKADAIRHFIYGNSVHDIDDEFYSYWHNIPTLMVMLRQYARSSSISGHLGERPHLECASRSALMYHLLATAGVRGRFVIVQPDISDKQTHTFLEVQDPADGSWSIQDPDANVYWAHADDGHRAGVADLLAHPIRSTIVPCHAEGECGYDDYTNLIVPYFAMAVVLDPQQQDVPALYNPARIDQRDLFYYTAQRWRYCVLFSDGCRYSVREVSSVD